MTCALGPFLHGVEAFGVLRLSNGPPILRGLAPQPRDAVSDEPARLFGLLDRRIAPRLGLGIRVEGWLLFHLRTLLARADTTIGRPA
jgi:hypothetical protein